MDGDKYPGDKPQTAEPGEETPSQNEETGEPQPEDGGTQTGNEPALAD